MISRDTFINANWANLHDCCRCGFPSACRKSLLVCRRPHTCWYVHALVGILPPASRHRCHPSVWRIEATVSVFAVRKEALILMMGSRGDGPGDGSSGLVFLESCLDCHGPDEPSPCRHPRNHRLSVDPKEPSSTNGSPKCRRRAVESTIRICYGKETGWPRL